MITRSTHDAALSDLTLKHRAALTSLTGQIDTAGKDIEDLNRQITVCQKFAF